MGKVYASGDKVATKETRPIKKVWMGNLLI